MEVLGNRKIVIVRELTKIHEETIHGNLAELTEHFANKETKGEIVLVIDREEIEGLKTETESIKSIAQRVSELENTGFDYKLALKKAAKEFGLSKSEAYRILQTAKNNLS